MPVFRAGNAPAWCELENFELIELGKGQTRRLPPYDKRQHVVVCRGTVTVGGRNPETTLPEGGTQSLDGPEARGFIVTATSDKALVCHLMGRWSSVTSSGVFAVQPAEPPALETPHEYVKTTGLDNHYHDCDEYWIFFEGRARVASEGRFYDVGPGDCVATGRGWHHDVLSVENNQPARAVWFEGSLEGNKRKGHLWEPQHGKANVQAERI